MCAFASLRPLSRQFISPPNRLNFFFFLLLLLLLSLVLLVWHKFAVGWRDKHGASTANEPTIEQEQSWPSERAPNQRLSRAAQAVSCLRCSLVLVSRASKQVQASEQLEQHEARTFTHTTHTLKRLRQQYLNSPPSSSSFSCLTSARRKLRRSQLWLVSRLKRHKQQQPSLE